MVVDASVAAKWFMPEEGSGAALQLLNSDTSLAGPSLLRVEVAAAITRKVRLREMEAGDALEAVDSWLLSLARNMVTLYADEADLPAASRLATELKHPLQDCLYLALAIRLETALITADSKFAKRARTAYPNTLLLGKDWQEGSSLDK